MTEQVFATTHGDSAFPTIRVLHLIDQQSGDLSLMLCERATRIGGASHTVVLIGDTAFEERAWGMGVTSTDRIVPRGAAGKRTLGAASGLARWLKAREQAGHVPFDVVQCWSMSTLALAELANVSGVRVGVVDQTGEVDPSVSYFAGRARYDIGNILDPGGPAVAMFDSATAGILARELGDEEDFSRLIENVRLLTPPSFALRASSVAERAATRQRLGIGAGDVVVQLLADPPERGDCLKFAFILGLVFTAGHSLVGLMPAGSQGGARAARFVHAHENKWRMIEHTLSIADAMSIADVAIWEPTSCGVAGLALAAAMGVPTVAAPCALSRDVLTSSSMAHHDLLASSAASTAMVRPMLGLLDQPMRRISAGKALKNAWVARFGMGQARFEDDLLDLWRERINMPVLRSGLPTPLALIGPESIA